MLVALDSYLQLHGLSDKTFPTSCSFISKILENESNVLIRVMFIFLLREEGLYFFFNRI